MILASIVYILCALTSILCLVLLWRGYRKSKAKLLLWSALCFAGLALDNVLVVVDLLLMPEVDLLWARQVATLASVMLLLLGFIWEAEE